MRSAAVYLSPTIGGLLVPFQVTVNDALAVHTIDCNRKLQEIAGERANLGVKLKSQ